MDEITLIHTGLAWDVKNLIFCHSGSSKIHCTHKHSNTCHGLNFYSKDIYIFIYIYIFFLNALNNVLYIRINNNLKLQTTPIYAAIRSPKIYLFI